MIKWFIRNLRIVRSGVQFGPVEMLFKLMKEKKRNDLKAEVENSQ